MSHSYSPTGVRPSPANVAFVRRLLAEIGPVATAKQLCLSRNAILAFGAGLHVHRGTDAQVTDCRLEDEATRAA